MTASERIRLSAERGFTLIELLTVIATIGVLAAIAIPQFGEYRQRGFDARSLQELRNAATAEEAYFSEHGSYVNCVDGVTCEAILPEFRHSVGVDISMTRVAPAGGVLEHFTGSAFHLDGMHRDAATAYRWDSHLGGLQ